MSRTHDVTISAFDLDHLEKELAAVTEQRDEARDRADTMFANHADILDHARRERDEAREQRDRLAGLKYPEDLTVDFVKILLETVKCGGKVVTFNDSDICTMERILKGGSHES